MSPSPSKNTMPLKRSAVSSCDKEGVEGNGGMGVCVDEGVCVGVDVDTGEGRGRGKGSERGRGRGMAF